MSESTRPASNEPDDASDSDETDDSDIGWGEWPEPADDERLERERPPHWA